MRNNIETFQIWAPDDALWTDWAKPVLFATGAPFGTSPVEVELDWLGRVPPSAMLIVDLPNREGVDTGIALARHGYRPVPLYNGVVGPSAYALVDARSIAQALFVGANTLAKLDIRPDAPPAFLLDANRMRDNAPRQGKFDNRWCVFPQDMPSAAFVQAQGLADVLVYADRIATDLSHILRRYQEAGIRIWHCNRKHNVAQMNIAKPSRFRSALYRYRVIAGLTRNSAGGFGEMIPSPQQSGSGRGYHGFG